MATLTGIRAAAKLALNAVKYRNMRLYEPASYQKPERMLDQVSAWRGHEAIIADIIQRFNLPTTSCLEFGVEYGYSTAVFANYFQKVTGVDIFTGDVHSGVKQDHYAYTKEQLASFDNIELVKADYRDWIRKDENHYDLIHVDIIHEYAPTYECGLWSAQHSTCTIFHDTESFPEVKRAVRDIARATGRAFYNYPFSYGLGIVV